MKKSWVTVLGILILGAGAFFFKDKIINTSPKIEVGEKVTDLGREHVEDIYGVTYSSDPPTSGPHFPIWAKRGMYDRLISDGYLIHSLEHGFVIVSYDCTKKDAQAFKLLNQVLAHDDNNIPLVVSTASGDPLVHMNYKPDQALSWFTPENPPAIEKPLVKDFESSDCKSLVDQLKPVLDKYDRIIITPRQGMETKIVLTSWARILKLDTIDMEKIESFINIYHNKGPEKTME